jgi:hypothetical protein
MPTPIPTLETLQAIAPEIVSVERSSLEAAITIRIKLRDRIKRLVPDESVSPPVNRLVEEPAVYMDHKITDLVLLSMAGTAGLIDYVRRVVDHAKTVYHTSQTQIPPFAPADFTPGRAGEAAALQREARIRYASSVQQEAPGRPLIDVLFEDEAPIDDYTWAGDEPQPPPEPREPERFSEDDSSFQARLLRKQRKKAKEKDS